MNTIVAVRSSAAAKCAHCPARNLDVCGMLGESACQDIGSRSSTARHQRGSDILVQGEPCEKIGILVSGLVKIVANTEGGDEHLLQLLRPGELVGDPFSTENDFSWIAATEVELCWMTPSTLDAMFRNNPGVYRGYLSAVAKQLKDQHLAAVSMRGHNTLQRVAHWLFGQAPGPVGKDFPQFRIPLSRKDLASLLDMTVETLCRVLHQLAERRAINLLAPDLVEVTDIVRLRMLAGDDDDGWSLRAPAARRGVAPPILRAAAPSAVARIDDLRKLTRGGPDQGRR